MDVSFQATMNLKVLFQSGLRKKIKGKFFKDLYFACKTEKVHQPHGEDYYGKMKTHFVRSQVLTAVVMTSPIIWDYNTM
jgi:hypothetical protein